MRAAGIGGIRISFTRHRFPFGRARACRQPAAARCACSRCSHARSNHALPWLQTNFIRNCLDRVMRGWPCATRTTWPRRICRSLGIPQQGRPAYVAQGRPHRLLLRLPVNATEGADRVVDGIVEPVRAAPYPRWQNVNVRGEKSGCRPRRIRRQPRGRRSAELHRRCTCARRVQLVVDRRPWRPTKLADARSLKLFRYCWRRCRTHRPRSQRTARG